MMSPVHFDYVPPALSESEMHYIQEKYEDPEDSKLIYHIRAPIVSRLDEILEANNPDDQLAATILRFMYINDCEDRYSNEWMLMCSFANDSIIFSQDRISVGEYTNKLTMHLLMSRYPQNMPAYVWLDRQYCYKWIYRFDHPETLIPIEQELNERFGPEAKNPKDLIKKLKVPSKLYHVARQLSVDEIVTFTRSCYAANAALSVHTITDLLFDEAERLRTDISSTTT